MASGRPVLAITGGGSGLGEDMALRFAQGGYDVAVCGRREDKLAAVGAKLEALGAGVHSMALDVREADKVQAWLEGARERFGRLDALICNAAGNFICPSLDLSPNGWRSVTSINLDGTFFASQAFGKIQVRDQRPGSILAIIAAYAWSGQPGTIHSAASKAGILAMMRTLAAEWGRHGIRCNTIAPGPVHTEGTDKNLWSVPGVAEKVTRTIPMGRLGTPQDISDAAFFLASEQASWISGAELTVDGAQWLHGGIFGWDPGKK